MIMSLGCVRDEPFDIGGGGGGEGGTGIFPSDKLFFSIFFAQEVIFFRSKLQQVFIFLKNDTLKSENVNGSNTLNEKVKKT